MYKKTTIIVSDKKVSINKLWLWSTTTQVIDNCDFMIRDILLQRKASKWTSYTDIDDISNTVPIKFVRENWDVILEFSEQDKNNLVKKNLFYWLMTMFARMDSDFYKERDCRMLFQIITWYAETNLPVEEWSRYRSPWRINPEIFRIRLVPHKYLEKIDFEIWDCVVLVWSSNLTNEWINKKTWEIIAQNFEFSDFHYLIYLWN